MCMDKKLKKAILGLVFLALFSVQSAFAKVYTLGVIEFWMPYGIAYVAAEKGFWKDEGIDVDVKIYKGDDAVAAFKHGKLDFYNIITSEAIGFVNNNPSNIFIYEYDWSNGGDKLLLSKRIANLDALQGQMIGLYAGTTGVRFFLHKILTDRSNVTLADVRMRVVKHTPSLSKAFRRGTFAAVVQFGPEAYKLTREGIGKVIATSADYPGIIGDGIITRKILLKEHPDVIRKLLRGWMRAIVWSSNPENRDAYFDILNRTIYKSAPLSKKELVESASEVIVRHTKQGVLEENGARLTRFTSEVLEYLQQTGVKLRSSNPAEYVDSSIAVEVAQEVLK